MILAKIEIRHNRFKAFNSIAQFFNLYIYIFKPYVSISIVLFEFYLKTQLIVDTIIIVSIDNGVLYPFRILELLSTPKSLHDGFTWALRRNGKSVLHC